MSLWKLFSFKPSQLDNLVSSVALPHKDNGKFGQDDGPLDGNGYLLGSVNTKTNMTIVVLNVNKNLEPALLVNLRLPLCWHDWSSDPHP